MTSAGTAPRDSSAPRTVGVAHALGALSLAGLVVAVVLIVAAVLGLASVATPNMTGFNPGASVTISDAGLSVYARTDDDRTSTVCTATGTDEITLDRPVSQYQIPVSGNDFYEVARAPSTLNAGSYTLTCEGTDQALYVGPAAPSTIATGLLGPAGLITGIVIGLVALVLGLVSLTLRRRLESQSAPGSIPGADHDSPYAVRAGDGGQLWPIHRGSMAAYDPTHGRPGQQTPPAGIPIQAPENTNDPASSSDHRASAPAQGGRSSLPGEPTQALAYGQGTYHPDALAAGTTTPIASPTAASQNTAVQDRVTEEGAADPHPGAPPPEAPERTSSDVQEQPRTPTPPTYTPPPLVPPQ